MNSEVAGHLRRVFGNAALLTIFRISADVAFIGFYVALSRRFGASGLGAYAFAMAVSSVVCGMPQAGLSKFLARNGSASEARYAALWRPTRTFSAAASVLSSVILLLIAWAAAPEVRTALLLVGAGQLCYWQAETFRATFAVRERLGRIAYAELLYKGTLLAVGLPLILLGAELHAALAVFPLAGLAYLFVVMRAARANRPRSEEQGAALRPTLRQAAPFLTTALLEAPIYRQHTILLAVFVGMAASGVFAAAWKLAEAALLCFSFVNAALLPTLTRLHMTNRAHHRSVLRRTSALIIGVAAVGAGVAAMLAPWIIHLLYGETFDAAIPVLQILCAVIVVTGLRQLLLTSLNAAGHAWRWAGAQGVSLAAGAAGAVLLIPQFGAIGAAFALLIGETIGCIAAALFYRSAREPSPSPVGLVRE